jgi:hypothetical protein
MRIATGLIVVLLASGAIHAQDRKRLPDVSATIKGDLALPVPLGTPVFNSITETIGTIGLTYQHPIWEGLGVGVGANVSWFGVEERALAPIVTSGEIRRFRGYGKVQWERYTGERSFYELQGRLGLANYTYDCPTCADNARDQGLHLGVGAGYYLHATENLAFGLTVSWESDAARFAASDLGLTGFPGRREVEEERNYQYLVVGMSFSTRLRRSANSDMDW